jgi:hypothetical protein
LQTCKFQGGLPPAGRLEAALPGRPPQGSRSLQRTEEIEYILLLSAGKGIEPGNDCICFRTGACVLGDRHEEIARPSVVEEEDPLAESPEGRRTELIRSGIPLDDVIGQTSPHVVHEYVGEEIGRLVTECSDRGGACG